METKTIKAIKRSSSGKNENNRLRSSGNVPINIIGGGKSVPASLLSADVDKLINFGIRQSTLISLELEGEGSSKVYVKELQRFPKTGKVRHIDFYKVAPGKKITTKIAVATSGVPKGSKTGGQFEHLIHEIKVKTTPEDLKDIITIDVTDLEIGDAIKISDLKVPASWEIIINGNPIVTSVNKTRALLAAERAEKQGAVPDAGKDAKGKAAPAAKVKK